MSYNAPGNVQYNYAQLEGIWCQAGGSPTSAPIAAAIAMAESGGNTTATNQDSNGTVDRGLWQVNSVHGAQSTYDVMGNARAAIAISNNGQSWAPWTTYGNGAYRQFIQTNVPADMSAPVNATNAAANATLTGAYGIPGVPSFFDPSQWITGMLGLGGVQSAISGTIQGAILSILNPFIQIVAGIAGLTAGGAMVLIGIFMMVKNTEAGQTAGKAAGFAAETGMSALGPEAAAATKYTTAGKPITGGPKGKGFAMPNQRGPDRTTTVTQYSRRPGQVKFGGRKFTYRPAERRTGVERSETPSRSTQDTLRNESNGYNRKREPK